MDAPTQPGGARNGGKMLESFMQQFRRGTEQLQRRSEEVAHSARLRLEIYQLTREQDALYARLGRAYHAGVDKQTLEELRGEIRQLEQAITGRETLMAELGEELPSDPVTDQAVTDPTAVNPVAVKPDATAPIQEDLPRLAGQVTHPRWSEVAGTPIGGASSAATQTAPSQTVLSQTTLSQTTSTQPPANTMPAGSGTASRIWRAKERERQGGEG